MLAVRPLTRLCAMLQARMLLEDPGCWNAILHEWPQLMHQTLARWGEQEDKLQQAFEMHRYTTKVISA